LISLRSVLKGISAGYRFCLGRRIDLTGVDIWVYSPADIRSSMVKPREFLKIKATGVHCIYGLVEILKSDIVLLGF
jgi:hypothetical protein